MKCPMLMQLSFQMWTNQMQETLSSKKQGDAAFRAKDFSTAIDCYTQVTILNKWFLTASYLSTKRRGLLDLVR